MGGHFDITKLKHDKDELELKLNNPDIWSKKDEYNKINSELSLIKKQVEEYQKIELDISSSLELIELLKEEKDESMFHELFISLQGLKEKIIEEISDIEINTLLNGEFDKNNCYLEIHPGAGGTESQDWANMLLRMYTMYFSKNGYKYEIVDKQDATDAGIKSVMIYVKHEYAYGYLKGEVGVHRLVRISPFDSNHRRHTSFAAVNVIPEFETFNDIEIKDEDIRVDVYRSSGCGGQGVNTTDSAVRITHIPTGIVVTVQNERSQIRNKEIAQNILKSKLYKLKLDEQNDKINSIKGNSKIDFGSQIRSYILEPYSLVKDVRSNYTSSNPKAILDGEIDELLKSVLKARDNNEKNN